MMDQSMDNPKRTSLLTYAAWILCGLVAAFAVVNLARNLLSLPADIRWIRLASEVVFILLPTVFSLMAALIASRQPSNLIVWLLMIIAIAITSITPVDHYIDSFTSAPEPTTPLILVTVWYQNWSWLLFIIPLLLIILLFPDGKPPSPRLRWVSYFAVGLVAAMASMTALSQTLSPSNFPEWMLPNPIGVIPDSARWLATPLLAGLALLVVLCPASLFYRYRRAGMIERKQILWLLYTSALFAIIYLAWIGTMGSAPLIIQEFFTLLTFLTISLFPAAIAIAILRYRLWDIDVLIRKSLIYTALTTTLVLVYLGATTLLQKVFGDITGTENSSVAIVVSTLAIAAMFNPLRRRIQHDIDRRFSRKKYDAEQMLAQFTLSVRDEVELEQLSEHLLAVVRETMQPEKVSLWQKKGYQARRQAR
jgi:hypothetical protein